MAGLDLSGLKRVVDGWISTSTLLIVRDNGALDDELDEGTGQLISPEPDVVYDGPGAVQPIEGFSHVPDPEAQRILQATDARYRALLPLEVDVEILAGDRAAVTADASVTADPLLTRRVFEVVELGTVSSFAVVRFVYLKQIGFVES